MKLFLKNYSPFQTKNMTNFPLYDSLNNSIPKKTKDLSVKQKEEFTEKIKKIEPNDRDLLYALIQIYHNNNESPEGDGENEFFDDPIELPYGGKREEAGKGKENLTWVLTDFPIRLRHIVYKFVIMCTKKMEDEEILLANRDV